MIEIALALAVIGIALVAVIGALPQGVEVQRDNRRETIINQDANFYMNALRGGAQRLDDLTNYVRCVTNHWVYFESNGVSIKASGDDTYTNFSVTLLPFSTTLGYQVSNPYLKTFNGGNEIADYRLTNGLRILGVLGTPRYFRFNDGTFVSNNVIAYATALSGAANEKTPQTNDFLRELAFSYRFAVQIAPVTSGATNWNNGSFDAQFDAAFGTNAAGTSFEKELRKNLHANLYDVRLHFRWPLLPNGDIGRGEKKFRTEVGGAIQRLPDPAFSVMRLFYFRPQTYIPYNLAP